MFPRPQKSDLVQSFLSLEQMFVVFEIKRVYHHNNIACPVSLALACGRVCALSSLGHRTEAPLHFSAQHQTLLIILTSCVSSEVKTSCRVGAGYSIFLCFILFQA